MVKGKILFLVALSAMAGAMYGGLKVSRLYEDRIKLLEMDLEKEVLRNMAMMRAHLEGKPVVTKEEAERYSEETGRVFKNIVRQESPPATAEKIPYNSFSTVAPIEDETPTETKAEEAPTTSEPRHEIMDYEDYAATPSHLCAALYYYAEDQILTDELHVPVEDEVALIGPEALNMFGVRSGFEDMVFVLNKDTNTRYEITRLNRSYQGDILGNKE